MKKIFILSLFSLYSIASFAQSFSVDSRSMSVPRYANQAAIITAIPSPTNGQMVYDNALNQYAYYNGTAWTNFPSASSGPSGPVLWAVNAANRIAANAGYPAGIQVDKITSQASNSSLANALINAEGGGTTFFKYGTTGGAWSISQEAVTGFTLGASSINWRYNDNANPQGTNHLFGYSANALNITGALNATGNGTIGGNLAVTGTSTINGKTIIGTSSATAAGMELRSSTSTDANPDIYFKGTNNVLRYGNNVDGTSIIQTTLSNNTPNTASLSWKHLSNAATPVATPMMSIDGEGDLTVSGFTKLGNITTATTAATANTVAVTRSQPAVKQLYLTGTTNTGTTSFITTDFPHGLDATKIISCEVLINALNNFLTPPQHTTLAGYSYSVYTSSSNVSITFPGTNSTALGGKSFKVLITYIP